MIPTLYKGIKDLARPSDGEKLKEGEFDGPIREISRSYTEGDIHGNKINHGESQSRSRETRFVNKDFAENIHHKPTKIKTEKRVNIDVEDDIAPLPRRKKIDKEHSV